VTIRRNAPRPSALLVGLVGLAAATTLSSCSSPQPPPACPTQPLAHGLAVAVGGHANAPRPTFPIGSTGLAPEIDRIVALSDQAQEFGAPSGDRPGATLIRVDGRPSVGCVRRYAGGGNGGARSASQKKFTAAVMQDVAALGATHPESDPLAALQLAASTAGEGGTVALIDSGLQTVAPLDFRAEPGLLTASVDRVVDRLDQGGHLPDLSDRDVVLVSIGWTVDPQPALDKARRTHLIELWRSIAAAGGARSVRVVDEPSTSPSAPDLPAVGVVPVPPVDNISLGCGTETILSDDGPVGFRQGSTTFVDPAAAETALRRFATWFRDTPEGTGHIVGSIAHYDDFPQLSRDRAETVRRRLVELGVDPVRLTAKGAGWGPYPNPTAPPDNQSDPLNRRVVVELVCP
jgi:outer membrane protein OmpA-like peptidoglycan-associated protein